MPRERAERLLFSRVGGSLDEVSSCLEFLHSVLLTQQIGDRLARTRNGDLIAKKIRKGESHELALFLLRSGALAEQIRTALAVGKIKDDTLRLPLAQIKRASPQLLAVLSRIPDVLVGSPVVIPAGLVSELESAWNQCSLPVPAALGNADLNLQVGERAELYSLQLECSAYVGASVNVNWVSRDDPKAGYDLEVRREEPSRCIEVKGSRGKQLAFILTTNELDTARRLGPRYEINFWGDVRLHLRARDDYLRLREAGYPVVIRNPAAVLFTEQWVCQPTEYRVRHKEP